jgi:hypothetical protein
MFPGEILDTTGRHAYCLTTMRGKNSFKLSLVTLTCTLGILLIPLAAHAQKISKTAETGGYSITLKVLPAESFGGSHAEMARDGGAEPNAINGPEHPNHHLVAFVKEDGKPVETAKVSISYRNISSKKGEWVSLPVARMHVAGKGLETTHYGNNVKLAPGKYEARVVVNGSKPAVFHFSLKR